MRFSFDKKSNIETLINYFYSFGFFAHKKAVKPENKQKFYNTANQILRERRGVSLESSPLEYSALEGAIWESYPQIQEMFLTEEVLHFLNSALGENWIYLGSDFNVFSSVSTHPWHRDWRLRLPVVKIGYYMLQDGIQGGQLRIIPGTQKLTDTYSRAIQKATNIPHEQKSLGGLNENNYFPLNKIYSRFHEANEFACDIPHAALDLNDGEQFVYFDPRAFHTGTVTLPPTRRIMFSSIFCPNPFDETFPLEKLEIPVNREQLANDLAEALLIDRMFYNHQETYDRDGKKPNLTDNHLIKLGFEDNNQSISFFNKTIPVKLINFETQHPKYSSPWLHEYIKERSKIYFR